CVEGDVQRTAPRITPRRRLPSATGAGTRVSASIGFSTVPIRIAPLTTAITTRPAARFATVSSVGVSDRSYAANRGAHTNKVIARTKLSDPTSTARFKNKLDAR